MGATMLSGCASFDARPKFIMKEKTAIALSMKTTYEETQLQIQCALTGIRPVGVEVITRENYVDRYCEKLPVGNDYAKILRNRYIGTQITAIDTRYEHFLRHVSRQFRGSNVTLDILGFGLTTAASVTGASLSRALSAASSGVYGSRAAISRDVFYERTLAALVDEMNAARDQAKAAILNGMKRSIDDYPLELALIDLRAYESAPSLDAALQKLSKSAAEDAKDAGAKVAIARSCLPESDGDQLRANVINHLNSLIDDKNTLKAYALRSKVVSVDKVEGMSAADLREALMDEMSKNLCKTADLRTAVISWGVPESVWKQ